MVHTRTMFLLGLCKGCFAAYRITLSMVAGGTRRRRLDKNRLTDWEPLNHLRIWGIAGIART